MDYAQDAVIPPRNEVVYSHLRSVQISRIVVIPPRNEVVNSPTVIWIAAAKL